MEQLILHKYQRQITSEDHLRTPDFRNLDRTTLKRFFLQKKTNKPLTKKEIENNRRFLEESSDEQFLRRFNAEDSYIASFIGITPLSEESLTIFVSIDNPGLNAYTGGAVAAPLFAKIAESSLNHLGYFEDE